MAADPDPFDRVANQLTDRAVMIAYANGEPITSAAFQLFEIERPMAVIKSSQVIAPIRSPLHVPWKSAIQLPKAARAL